MSKIHLKRAYERPSKIDGKRILVERLWPRGLKKTSARIDLWLKDVAPSGELRKWFGHQVERWPQFRTRYQLELRANKTAIDQLLEQVGSGDVTFIYSAADTEHNSAIVLKEFIEKVGRRQ